MALYRRKVIVQLDGEPTTDAEDSFSPVSLEGFYTTFRVTKTLGGEPNKATVTLRNVSPDRVPKLDRNMRVRILAGYGDYPQLIFEGNPTKGGAVYTNKPPTPTLEIEAATGLRRWQRARVNVSFSDETTAEQVLSEVSRQLGYPDGYVEVPDNFRLTQGGTFAGPAREVMDRLAASLDAEWSLQDNKLQLVPGSAVTTELGPLYSTGLRNMLDVAATDEGIKAVVLLDPSILPGGRFRIDDDTHGGVFKATKVTHRGDSGFGQNFVTEIEATVSPV